MRVLAATLALALAVLPLAGCLDRADGAEAAAPDVEPAAAPRSNSTVAARSGGAAAPTSPFTVPDAEATTATTIHPYSVPGQTARATETLRIEQEYGPQDCTLPVSWAIGDGWREYPFTDKLQPGDAVLANATLTFETTESDFADLHLWVNVPGQSMFWQPISEPSDVGVHVQSFEFQFAFPGDAGAEAVVGVGCYYATNTNPVPFTIDVTLSFGEGVVAGGNPHLVRVSGNVKELRVSGAPFVAGETVAGHFRLFRPDDSLVGEFALNSDEAYAAVPVDAPGDYVIIVDHSERGMLAIGADAPPADPVLQILESDWALVTDHVTAQPGPVQTAVTFDVPRVPLHIEPWFRAVEPGATYAKKVVMDLDGPEGRVWHVQAASFISAETGEFDVGFGTAGADAWESEFDHHALAKGTHTLALAADFFHGEFYHWYVTYLRPGESGVPAPGAGGDAVAAPTLPAPGRLPVG